MEFINTRAGLEADEQQVTQLLDQRQKALDDALDELVEVAHTMSVVAGERDTARADLVDLQARYDAHMATHTPTPPAPVRQIVLGMSAFPEFWDRRLAEVGPESIGARRIFCDLAKGVRDKEALIRAAIADGMIPVLSYKGVPTSANTAALKAFLTSLDTTVTATYWHEPHGDMTPAEFRTRSRVFLDGVQAPAVKVGPILNGWLLDNREADWTSYTDAALLRDWDFVGVDTYSEGTVAAPSSTLLTGRALPKMQLWLTAQGHPDKPIVVGEFNGQTEAGIKYAAGLILTIPNVWIACLWNVDHTQDGALKFNVLTGARLAAFKAMKADPRVKK